MHYTENVLERATLFSHVKTHGSIYGRLALPTLILAMVIWPATRETVIGVLSDAFLAVSVFVFATLLIFNWATDLFNTLRKNHGDLPAHWQVPGAAVLGALPGCGGAIVVVTQYVQGGMTFGSLVAVLTATMGDAAFVLLAARPTEGLLVIVIGVVVGSIMGYLIDALGLHTNLVSKSPEVDNDQPAIQDKNLCGERSAQLSENFWRWSWPPLVVISGLIAFQVNPDTVLSLPESTTHLVGAMFCIGALLCWACNRSGSNYQTIFAEENKDPAGSRLAWVVQSTHFVTAWVVVAFLMFELTILATGFDFAGTADSWGLWAPAVGVSVGLLPGCGPQIMLTSLYLQDVVPFSSLLGNAISNDGDALFPAIALAPKAAIMATLYSTPPAFIVAYGYQIFFT